MLKKFVLLVLLVLAASSMSSAHLLSKSKGKSKVYESSPAVCYSVVPKGTKDPQIKITILTDDSSFDDPTRAVAVVEEEDKDSSNGWTVDSVMYGILRMPSVNGTFASKNASSSLDLKIDIDNVVGHLKIVQGGEVVYDGPANCVVSQAESIGGHN